MLLDKFARELEEDLWDFLFVVPLAGFLEVYRLHAYVALQPFSIILNHFIKIADKREHVGLGSGCKAKTISYPTPHYRHPKV